MTEMSDRHGFAARLPATACDRGYASELHDNIAALPFRSGSCPC